MGALLSLPLAIPSMVGSWAASACGAAICTALCNVTGTCASSVATRIGYAVIFLLNSILSWIFLTDWAVKKLEHLTFDYMKITCHGGECYGFVAVQRVNFALGLFHLILCGLLVGVHSSRNPRASIQNGYWGLKIFAWLSLVVLSFFIPEGFFVIWGNYFAMIGSFIFILIGLVLLVDFAHTWAETCLQHVEEDDNSWWKFLLVGSTAGGYIGSFVLITLMYVFFASPGCSMNQAAITIDLVFTIIITVMSVHPIIREYNPQAGLAQSAMVSAYCAYLTMSAVASEPDDRNCNPLVRSKGTRSASIVLGALFTFLAIAYTTTRAAITTSTSYEPLSTSDTEVGLVTREPTRSEMRVEALRAAVADGTLPESALNESWGYDDDESDSGGRDDERGQTKYNYVIFHIIFLLATQWTATLLTMNVEKDVDGDFAPVGRTYFSVWVKIISAWMCFFLYGWTLIAPVMFPERFG